MQWSRLTSLFVAIPLLALLSCTADEPASIPAPAAEVKPEVVEPLDSIYAAPASLKLDKLTKKEKAWLTDLEAVRANPDFITGLIDGDEDNYGADKAMRVNFVRTDYGLNVALVNVNGVGVAYEAETGQTFVTRTYAVSYNTQARLDVLLPALAGWREQYNYWPQTYFNSRTSEWIMSGAPVGKTGSTVVLDLPGTFRSRGHLQFKQGRHFIYTNEKTNETVKVRVRDSKIVDTVATKNVPVL